MAGEIKIKGKTIVTAIKREADTDFRIVACSTGDVFNGTTNSSNTTDKCSDGWEETDDTGKNWNITSTGKGIVIDEDGTPAPSQASVNLLAALWISGEVFDIRMANADGTYYRGGKAKITSWSETAPDDGSPLTYSATFSGQGAPFLTEPETT